MQRQNLVSCLDFDDYLAADQQVETEGALDLLALVKHWDRDLSVDEEIARRELVGEALFIGGFKQAWAKFLVNGEGRVNDVARNVIFS